MTGIALGLRALLSMLATKGLAIVAVGLALGTGGAVLASRELSSPSSSTHGAAVVAAIHGTCAQLLPGASTAGAAATASPGAFGQCVSRVARSNHGSPPVDGNQVRGAKASAGRGAATGPPSWAKGRGNGRHRGPGTALPSAP